MNLSRITHIYQRSGRVRLVNEIEQYSIAAKAKILAEIGPARYQAAHDTAAEELPNRSPA